MTLRFRCGYWAILALAWAQSPVWAQWLNQPTAGIPRTADGKPDLSAPAPKVDGHPDLSGLWQIDPAPYPRTPNDSPNNNSILRYMPPNTEIGMLPWAAELYQKRAFTDIGAGRPSEICLPHSIPGQYFIRERPIRLVQTRLFTAMLFEQLSQYRNIYTDGRSHPEDMQPVWLGYSVGKWDGDTFVVETKGITERTWLDDSGHPHTDEMRTIERFRRPDFGHMLLEFVIDDPKTYAKPVTLNMSFTFMADTDMIEHICENEKDHAHMTLSSDATTH